MGRREFVYNLSYIYMEICINLLKTSGEVFISLNFVTFWFSWFFASNFEFWISILSNFSWISGNPYWEQPCKQHDRSKFHPLQSSYEWSLMVRFTLHFGWITHLRLPNVIKARLKHFHSRLRSQTRYHLLGLILNIYYVQRRSSYDQ